MPQALRSLLLMSEISTEGPRARTFQQFDRFFIIRWHAFNSPQHSWERRCLLKAISSCPKAGKIHKVPLHCSQLTAPGNYFAYCCRPRKGREGKGSCEARLFPLLLPSLQALGLVPNRFGTGSVTASAATRPPYISPLPACNLFPKFS